MLIYPVVLIIIVAIIYIYTYRRSTILAGNPPRRWNVVDYKNKQAAAELLAEANVRMVYMMRILKKKYHVDETDEVIKNEAAAHTTIINGSDDLHNLSKHLLYNYNPDAIYETDPRYTSNTSYTIRKGAAMYLCLRDKGNNENLVAINDLIFVIVHECAHIANYKYWGHEIGFWIIFKWLLHEAVLAGIYVRAEYSKNPIMYCGLKVEYQPLDDEGLPNIWEH